MNKRGPIIVIDDDEDDQQLLVEIFQKLGYINKVVYFFEGHKALEFLHQIDVRPFFILCDINMPKLSGIELRAMILSNNLLRTKCFPFLFFTTSADGRSVRDAYTLSVQGYFQKPNSVYALQETIRKIVEFWQECIAPNEYNDLLQTNVLTTDQ